MQNRIVAASVAAVLLGLILYALIGRGADEGWRFVFALLTLVLGFLAWAVSDDQRTVARAKLRLDLFERRYAIFEVTWDYLSRCTEHKVPPRNAELAVKFANSIPQAAFLFGRELETYLNTIRDNAITLWLIQERTAANYNVLPPEDIERHTELQRWFFEEARQGAKTIFGRYLSFENWQA
ncbi:hypothetical protein CJO81_03090 [Ralstonia solanacearum]|uniref:hypothetical protein n=1 Tax=Ralstonia pseudosolanacearum TaxID=1310165 RepID=UPI000E597867|nr:hypothetical protein [Ralstonia pseudosolanacearum]AXV99830.1 hypothetical protein CJO81_03090 [Ralstonia solanacearum]AXW27320.1 hypothetical protein CJO87_03085 [Ralstonia solanacearum]NJZ69008.1 hypothetical protein [Ralstonia solanacearum]NKF80221.1 hypothetical protein [Ralstonia solanacearum]UYR06914.1 hypothetical protein NQS38_00725 [Ralstonia pseudosolanacearum]